MTGKRFLLSPRPKMPPWRRRRHPRPLEPLPRHFRPLFYVSRLVKLPRPLYPRSTQVPLALKLLEQSYLQLWTVRVR